jgi:hypothetical protein
MKTPKTETILVAQEFFIGEWSDNKSFSADEEKSAIACMQETYKLKRRPGRVIERRERVIASTEEE